MQISITLVEVSSVSEHALIEAALQCPHLVKVRRQVRDNEGPLLEALS